MPVVLHISSFTIEETPTPSETDVSMQISDQERDEETMGNVDDNNEEMEIEGNSNVTFIFAFSIAFPQLLQNKLILLTQ